MIAFPCPSCQKKLLVQDERVGEAINCPSCGKAARVPNPSVVSSSASEHPRTMPLVSCHSDQDSGPPTAPPLTALPTAPPASLSDATTPPIPSTSEGDANLTDFLAPPEADDELGRLGGFRILKILGHGGMGVVFLGEDAKLARKVAIKAMLPHLAQSKSSQQRFLREASAAAALEHDHIVPIFHVGEDRGAPFIVMPFLKGEPLDQRLQRDERLSIAEVLRIGREIAKGVGAAHAAGLIHRDIKPANIWLETPENRVKILDFGLARAATQESELTQQGSILGTPAYMAPEQARGETVNARCDLWSLGVVLYLLCTGELPFRGTNMLSTLRAVDTTNPEPPIRINPRIPVGLSDLVMKLLEKDPRQRIASAEEVVETLRNLELDHPAAQRSADPRTMTLARQGNASADTARQGSKSSFSSLKRSRKPLLLALGVGLTAALIAGIVMFWLRSEGGENNNPQSNEAADGLVNAPPDAPLSPRFKNRLGMAFVLVPKGKFRMGGGGGHVGAKMEIFHDYYLGQYEVTQEEWQKVTGRNPSWFARTGGGKQAVKDIADADLQRFPVEQVSWNDAQDFLERLNAQTKEEGWVYRLPTEAEWEYACRGGPVADAFDYTFYFYFDKPTNELLPTQANFEYGKGLKRTCKVGSYTPNRLRLYDMHGNVVEWCDDEVRQAGGAAHRGDRGGCWLSRAKDCRAATRFAYDPAAESNFLGLRLARVPVGKEKK